MSKVQIRKPFTRVRTIANNPGKSVTVVSEGNDTDVNKIVERFTRIGSLPPKPEETYADVTGLQGDLAENIQKAQETQDQFTQELKAAMKAEKEKAEVAAAAAQAIAKDKTGKNTQQQQVDSETE